MREARYANRRPRRIELKWLILFALVCSAFALTNHSSLPSWFVVTAESIGDRIPKAASSGVDAPRLLVLKSDIVPKPQETKAVEPQASSAEISPANRRRRQVSALLSDVYGEHFLRLVHRLRSVFGNGPPEPEDVAQRAFEQLTSVDALASINNIEAFLWRVAKNVRISELRSNIASQARSAEYSALFLDNDGDHFSPERVFFAKEDIKSAVKVIEAMPEHGAALLC